MVEEFKKYDDTKVMNGYGSAILVKDASQGETLYHLLITTEEVGFPSGENETFDFNLLQSSSKGKTIGKKDLNNVSVSFMAHRDNFMRLDKYKGKTCDFLSLNPDMTGIHYVGVLDYSQENASADNVTGTLTIVPISMDNNYIMDCRELIEPTIVFASVIPDKVLVDKQSIELDCTTNPTDGVSVEAVSESEGTVCSAAWSDGKLTITRVANGTDLVTLKATKTGYAEWISSILVTCEGQTSS